MPDDDAIAAEFNPFAELLVTECAGAFGMAKDAGMREEAEARLRITTPQQRRRLAWDRSDFSGWCAGHARVWHTDKSDSESAAC